MDCRSLRSKFPEFEARSQNIHIDVIILSETWLDEADIVRVYLRWLEVVRKERAQKAGDGVAIYINKELKYSQRLYDGDGIV
jgi:hypothetical protein